MFWEDDDDSSVRAPHDVIDVSFKIKGKTLAWDHADTLRSSLYTLLPWLSEQKNVGFYISLPMEEGNGWMRDDVAEPTLYLSRRAKLVFRIHASLQDELQQLIGQILDLDGHQLEIGASQTKQLAPIDTVYSRHVVTTHDDEQQFLDQIYQELNAMGIKAKKMMCGRIRTINTENGQVTTRSLMIADIDKDDAILLQKKGLGKHLHWGCGLFMPFKSIKQV